MSKQRTSRRPNDLLRRERLLRGWTQQDVAGRIETDGYTVNRWERGRAIPSPYFRQKLCILFGKNAEELGLLGSGTNEEAYPSSLSQALRHPEHAEDGIALPPYWHVPYQRNPFFTGREQTLQQLHQLLCQQQAVTLTPSYALSGLGGIGKTQTAVEYAYRSYPDYSAVFWIGAQTAETITASLVSIAQRLDLPEQQERDQSKVVTAVISWLNAHRDWLLLLDNVEDLELVKRFLPTARRGSLLFTTRLHTLGTLAYSIILEQMSVEEGRQFLLRRTGYAGPDTADARLAPGEDASARALVVAMAGLPLALDQAGAYIEKTQTSLSSFLHLFRTSPCQVLRERDGHADHPFSVVKTFTLSFERLRQTNPAAADLLTLCCFLAPDAIPESLITEHPAHLSPSLQAVVSHPLQFNALCHDLLAYSLLHRDAQTKTITIHRLVQAVLKRSMPADIQQQWAERTLRLVNQAFPEGDFARWAQCERYLPQALACIPLMTGAGKHLPEAGELLWKAGRYLVGRGRFEEASPLLEQAVMLGELHYGPNHPALLPRLTTQGELFWRQGKYACAEELASRALAIEKQHLEPTHVQIGETLNSLALLYLKQGKYEQAEPLFLRALQIWERHGHPHRAFALNNLAVLYREQGKYEQAEPLFLQVLRLDESPSGPEDPEVAFPLVNLAILYREQGQYAQAEPLLLRALRIREQALGPQHPDVALSLNGLATLYAEQGQYAQAEPLFLRALRIREQALGPQHPDVATVLVNLAGIYRVQKRYQEAESFSQRASCIREKTLGSRHHE